MKKSLAAWEFTQMDDFWKQYQALSPWGKDEVDQKNIYNDVNILSKKYDDISLAISFIKQKEKDSASLSRISYHLKRMPRIVLELKKSYELIELFQFKKFIANYRGLISQLGTEMHKSFEFEIFAQDSFAYSLSYELDKSGSDPETFYLADAYDEDLKQARQSIAKCDAIITAERLKAEAETRLSFGISFDGRDFVVVQKDIAQAMLNQKKSAWLKFALESYDDTRFIVRILPSSEAIDAMAEREKHLSLERVAEKKVIDSISELVCKALPQLKLAVRAVTKFDIALAGANLSLNFSMTKPKFNNSEIHIKNGFFIPCKDECEKMGLNYTALNINLTSNATVIFGSNMGGKTVVLKTVLFFQLLAQAGLFVPAEDYMTRVFDNIEYVGELAAERHTGLSGFGLEIWRLNKAWSGDIDDKASSLTAYDELARTTGSHEAEALLSAVIEAYTQNSSGKMALFASHFRAVARITGAVYCRMEGLDRNKAEAALKNIDAIEASNSSLETRLSGINNFMRYNLIPDDGAVKESDAISIASLLGLDSAIIDRAKYYLWKH